MSNTSIAFLITIISGLVTLLGILPIFINFKNTNKIIASSLSFASAVMLTISITDLIPESIKMLRASLKEIYIPLLILIAVFTGILISNILRKELINNKDSLYKVGLISMITIIIHNIPEGIVTFITTTNNTSIGLSLAIAIAIHNIPEGLSIGVPIYYSTKKRSIAFYYTLLASLSEPLGALLSYLFIQKIINKLLLGLLLSLISGLMISISLTELLPSSLSYKETRITQISFIIGIIIILIKLLI